MQAIFTGTRACTLCSDHVGVWRLGYCKLTTFENSSLSLLDDGTPPNGTSALFGGGALICFSHLRWGFVFQRPQHLMLRFAKIMPVFFLEEPVASDTGRAELQVFPPNCGVTVLLPRLPDRLDDEQRRLAQRGLLDQFCAEHDIARPVLWYYTPASGSFSDHLDAQLVVYDCMDELSAFNGADPRIVDQERALFEHADLVFTGGQSLYESKRRRHRHVHAFPSSIDFGHFAQARSRVAEPPDQQSLAHPRVGFFGVVDERLDVALLGKAVALRPDYQFIVVGPVVKIDPASLPRHPNLHYLGGKSYEELPLYLAGWDVAMMPFAINAATQFISPTKTPEYLAGGKPVVSTPVHDVVALYGDVHLVRIAASAEDFVLQVDEALAGEGDEWLAKVDALLARTSWETTWSQMVELMTERRRRAPAGPSIQRDAEAAAAP
jgi:UDP-galactopyranose mutase